MISTYDLGNLTCATWLRTNACHSRSTILHLYELTILYQPIGFALQTKSFNNIHVNRSSHRVVRLRIFAKKWLHFKGGKNLHFQCSTPLLYVEISTFLALENSIFGKKRVLRANSANE